MAIEWFLSTTVQSILSATQVRIEFSGRILAFADHKIDERKELALQAQRQLFEKDWRDLEK